MMRLAKLASRTARVSFLIGMLAASAHAQGCAMCYNNAAAADAQQRAALKRGILMLGTPALLFLGVVIVVARRSDRNHED